MNLSSTSLQRLGAVLIEEPTRIYEVYDTSLPVSLSSIRASSTWNLPPVRHEHCPYHLRAMSLEGCDERFGKAMRHADTAALCAARYEVVPGRVCPGTHMLPIFPSAALGTDTQAALACPRVAPHASLVLRRCGDLDCIRRGCDVSNLLRPTILISTYAEQRDAYELGPARLQQVTGFTASELYPCLHIRGRS